MTTRSTLRPQIADYAHLEQLPDPPREPDMQQSVGIIAFHLILNPYFSHRDDVLISGEGYLRHEATNNAERDDAEARANAAEAELARVREQLQRLQQD